MSEYKIAGRNTVIRVSDGAFISVDNADYLAWVAAGGVPEPADPILHPDVSAARAEQYRLRSDPLFFKWQRGEATEEAWLAEIAAIKAEFPDPA